MSISAICTVANMQAVNDALEAQGFKFYVYAHLDHQGIPFYIGKGHGRRHLQTRRRNFHHTNCLTKYGLDSVILFDNLSEDDAFKKESDAIKGCRNQGFSLANYTDGGEGSSGYKHSSEAIEKTRLAATGVPKSPETIQKCLASRAWYKHSDTTKTKISQAHLGKVFADESRSRMSKAQKERAASLDYVNPRKGVSLGESTKAKLRRANIGKKLSQETKDKISTRFKGRESPLKGRNLSEEHKARIKAASLMRTRNEKGAYQ